MYQLKLLTSNGVASPRFPTCLAVPICFSHNLRIHWSTTLGIKGAEPLGASVHTATPAHSHRHAARTFAIRNIQRAGQAVNHPALPPLAFAIRTQDDRARISKSESKYNEHAHKRSSCTYS